MILKAVTEVYRPCYVKSNTQYVGILPKYSTTGKSKHYKWLTLKIYTAGIMIYHVDKNQLPKFNLIRRFVHKLIISDKHPIRYVEEDLVRKGNLRDINSLILIPLENTENYTTTKEQMLPMTRFKGQYLLTYGDNHCNNFAVI